MNKWQIHSGYESFYKDVLEYCGRTRYLQFVLPADYKETAVYVIKNANTGEKFTDLTERESFVLMRYYGIGDYDQPATLKEIGKDLNMSWQRAGQIKSEALRKCCRIGKYGSRCDILTKGLAEYNLSVIRREEILRKEKLEKLEKVKSYDRETILKILSETPISKLKLSMRAYCMLVRHFDYTEGSILKLLQYSVEDLMEIRNIGMVSAVEINERLKEYVMEEFGITLDELGDVAASKEMSDKLKACYNAYKEKHKIGNA